MRAASRRSGEPEPQPISDPAVIPELHLGGCHTIDIVEGVAHFTFFAANGVNEGGERVVAHRHAMTVAAYSDMLVKMRAAMRAH